MEDRAHGRSRSIGNRRTKSRRQVGKQRKGCLGLLTGILIFAIVAAAVFFYGVYVREEKPSGTQPQTAEQPGTIVFPGDSAETITAVKSLQAGVDILLMPADFKEAYNGVLDAVNNGTISEERLNQSVRRILTLKAGL